MAARKLEIEIKLPVENLKEIRSRLRKLGFRCVKRRALETNLIWDSPGQTLRKKGVLLRLRQTGRGRPVVTLKGPRKAHSRFRIRPESEFILRNWDTAELLLCGMGYRPQFRYEKYRAVYTRARDKGAGLVCVDETPIGNYLELEGGKRWIRRATRELGFAPAQSLTASYADLYSRHRKRQKLRGRNMVFG